MRLSALLWLRHFPNTAIGVVLGISGHAVLWRILDITPFSHDTLGGVARSANWFFWLTGLATYGLVATAYALKALLHRDVVRAEFVHPIRSHFFNGPHIAALMLALGAPPEARAVRFLRAVWVLAAASQGALTQTFYARWLFSDEAGLVAAKPPYLLSTVGWFLLTTLGQAAGLEEAWHLPLPSWTFGSGVAMYSLVFISIFQGMRNSPGERGSPALFLLVAPSSVAALGLAGFNGGVFGGPSAALLGFNITMILVLMKLGPKLLAKPAVFGIYWAYVFPLAAVAACAVRQADAMQMGSRPVVAEVFAWIMVGIADLMLGLVFLRMTWHQVGVMRGKETWGCPIARDCDLKWRAGEAVSSQVQAVSSQVEAVNPQL